MNLGFISYDVFIPGDTDAPGINAVNIFNLTGDPLAGGFALEPDFPSYTGVTFLNSSLTAEVDGVTQFFALGDIGPGLFDASADLLFSETSAIASLIFSATLSATNFLLPDGTIFSTDSSALSLTLLPSNGPALTPGLDFDVLTVPQETNSTVPEPGAITLVVSGLIGIAVKSRMRARVRRSAGSPARH